MACGIFPDQGSNPCLLHWQVDARPVYHQGDCHSSTVIPKHLDTTPDTTGVPKNQSKNQTITELLMLGSKAGVEATNAASQYSHFPCFRWAGRLDFPGFWGWVSRVIFLSLRMWLEEVQAASGCKCLRVSVSFSTSLLPLLQWSCEVGVMGYNQRTATWKVLELLVYLG